MADAPWRNERSVLHRRRAFDPGSSDPVTFQPPDVIGFAFGVGRPPGSFRPMTMRPCLFWSCGRDRQTAPFLNVLRHRGAKVADGLRHGSISFSCPSCMLPTIFPAR